MVNEEDLLFFLHYLCVLVILCCCHPFLYLASHFRGKNFKKKKLARAAALPVIQIGGAQSLRLQITALWKKRHYEREGGGRSVEPSNRNPAVLP